MAINKELVASFGEYEDAADAIGFCDLSELPAAATRLLAAHSSFHEHLAQAIKAQTTSGGTHSEHQTSTDETLLEFMVAERCAVEVTNKPDGMWYQLEWPDSGEEHVNAYRSPREAVSAWMAESLPRASAAADEPN